MWFKHRIHPETKTLIQYVTTIDGIKFYEFKDLMDMPARRYSVLNEFIEDYRRGIDRDELNHNINECIDLIESNTVKGITDANILLKYMQSRMRIAYDVDLIMRLISCAIFTIDEDVTDYDWALGDWKIEAFKKAGVESFFLNEPLRKYWKSTELSKADLEIIIEQRKTKQKALNELSKMGISLQSGRSVTNKSKNST